MFRRNAAWFFFVALVITGLVLAGSPPADDGPKGAETPPEVAKVWTDEGLQGFELPLADSDATPVQLPPDLYYQLHERPIWKSYPVYHPEREPAGYLDWL